MAASVSIVQENNGFFVEITTKRLLLRSVNLADLKEYELLFGDAEVMSKYANGNVMTAEQIAFRVGLWQARWQANDPFSSLAVFLVNSTTFIGHVVLGHGDEPGTSELAYVFNRTAWGQGFGKEAIDAVVNIFAVELVRRGFHVGAKHFSSIVATTREDNEASRKILEHCGFTISKQIVKYNDVRMLYVKQIK